MTKINIALWDEERFANSRHEWNQLLANSDADQLFLSWEWQYTWWQVFAIPGKMQLKLLAATDESNTLIGLAPLYLSTVRTGKFFKVRRLQFIGNYWRTRDTMRTEFLDFISIKEQSADIISAIFAYIKNSREWDEFVLVNLRTDSDTFRILMQGRALPGSYLRKAEHYASYYVNTETSFEEYLGSLGKNTRLRIFNRRKVLESLGQVTFEINPKNLDENFELLNKLHSLRWGYPAFMKQRLKFNKKVATLLSAKNGLRFSVLSVDGQPISIQYNYVISDHVYNLQAGFDETIHNKISPGYLHFGYTLEHAFNSKSKCYDFLAGDGKNTPYKENLTKNKLDIFDIQIIRNKSMKPLYIFYDWLKDRNLNSS